MNIQDQHKIKIEQLRWFGELIVPKVNAALLVHSVTPTTSWMVLAVRGI